MKNISDKTVSASAVDDCAQAVNESWQRRTSGSPPLMTENNLMLPDGIAFCEIAYGSEDYKTTLALRHRVLREPLGLNLWHENLSAEIDQRHFTLWQHSGSLTDDNKKAPALVACLVIVPQRPDRVKLRQMAVSTHYQRRGLGQQLIAAVEKTLITEGVQLIELHAREAAVAFYQASGYQCMGPAFVEVGLPHRRMTKILTTNVTKPMRLRPL